MPQWPSKSYEETLHPSISHKINLQREGIKRLDESIEFWRSVGRSLSQSEREHFNELIRQRNAARRRLAELKRYGR